jgi:hypothetical protein
LGQQAESQPANLHHHHLKGVKIKIKKGITPRYAMTDLNNFATFTAPQAKEKAKFNAVQNYRKQLGSSNFDMNLETAYGKRITAGQHVPKYEAPTRQEVQLYEMSTQTSSTLQMFGMSKLEGAAVFDKHAPEYKSAFSKRMKSTFANIVEPEEIRNFSKFFVPIGFYKK